MQFMLYRGQMIDNRLSVGREPVVIEAVRKIRDRTTFIHRCDAEHVRDLRSEPFDSQLAIKKKGPDIAGCDQVLYVAVRSRYAVELELELGINGLKFLVDRLKFFLARLQLLRRRAIFFICG